MYMYGKQRFIKKEIPSCESQQKIEHCSYQVLLLREVQKAPMKLIYKVRKLDENWMDYHAFNNHVTNERHLREEKKILPKHET